MKRNSCSKYLILLIVIISCCFLGVVRSSELYELPANWTRPPRNIRQTVIPHRECRITCFSESYWNDFCNSKEYFSIDSPLYHLCNSWWSKSFPVCMKRCQYLREQK
ncbi:hypothetical protein DFA_08630 [Cavenderia fasciculata]|uniref:Uncharacterized protein n=1 Tax=Cavenderia fasciculata TaxID=261658 RepID=F4Q3C4_CACFS|nr:uncharacterized protein DFA_08630 [Cavenderia fasciculata]EGG17634.1 hypothetical protein DFA_08630 [Cavenderia fasciculata]|eukprot:XP_004356118.1 hypothetical protein DFA_08630 [Cavenderia fasciculata]